MSYDQNAPKRATNLTLNEDLVRQARALTSNLSQTVEDLLARHIEDYEAKQAQIDAYIAWSNAFVAEHGLIGEEWSSVP